MTTATVATRTDVGASTASTGQIAPHVNATADVHAACSGSAGREVGDAELVARVRAELVRAP